MRTYLESGGIQEVDFIVPPFSGGKYAAEAFAMAADLLSSHPNFLDKKEIVVDGMDINAYIEECRSKATTLQGDKRLNSKECLEEKERFKKFWQLLIEE